VSTRGRAHAVVHHLDMDRWKGDFKGNDYQRRFDELAAAGSDVHGEADFVMRFEPRTVLDAGCGTGRVGIELARRGVEVVGTDREVSMLAVARERGPEVEWVESDLTQLDLGRTFDVVVMAGNVPLFTPEGTHAALVAGCARHVRDGGVLIAGFQLGGGYSPSEYDDHAAACGLALEARWSTWDGDPFALGGDYAVSVHRRPSLTDERIDS
jgi:SAM-dependent methyltransferase